MSEIIENLWNSLASLNSGQWVVVFTLSLFFGFAIFCVFRWLYKSNLDAQSSLIQIKSETINHLKEHPRAGGERPSLSSIVPTDWKPYLSQPRSQLEEVLAETFQQQPMNHTSANIGFILDAELYIIYLRAVHDIPSEESKSLVFEQQNWLRRRTKHCSAQVKSHGGTLAPLEYSSAFIKFTSDRISELEDRYGGA